MNEPLVAEKKDCILERVDVVLPAIIDRIAELEDSSRIDLVVTYKLLYLLDWGHCFHKRYNFPGYVWKRRQLLSRSNDVFDQQFIMESVNFVSAQLSDHV